MPGIVISQSQLINRARPAFEDLTQPWRDNFTQEIEAAHDAGPLSELTSPIPASSAARFPQIVQVPARLGEKRCNQIPMRTAVAF